ncbi:MAG: hypothetical protein JNM43_08415 [Planctomycetaceae bacterium]|nr:hypothetical protein [Planctomycetaceae bacterium]
MKTESKPQWCAAGRVTATLLLLLTAVCQASVADEKVERPSLPKLTDMQLPSAEALLRADAEDKEFDWVVLKAPAEADRLCVVVVPIYPRPDTLKKMAEDYKKVEASRPQNQKEREFRANRLKALQRLLVKVPGDLNDYGIPVDQIDQIIFFEDLMLQRVDQLLEAGDFRTAYELLLRVETEIPNWDKSVPRFEKLLLVEAAERAKAGETYAALALLDEVTVRNKDSVQLPAELGRIVGPMIDDAISKEDYRKVRYLLTRVQKNVPNHELISGTQSRLQGQSEALLGQAAEKTKARDYASAAELARRAETIWPTTGNARAAFTQFFARHQVLRVGTNDFEGPSVYPAPLEHMERHRELEEVCLFEPSSADELTYFRSSFFEVWDPADLGREVLFTLRETRPGWQSQPLLTANQIADALADRMNPESPFYSPRVASYVKEVSVRSPSQLRIRFTRVPLSIESLMRFPATGRPVVTSESVSADNANAEAPQAHEHGIISTRFKRVKSDESGHMWLRQIPEPDGFDSSKYHIAEIQEHRFADRSNMFQALIRGDVDYVPHLMPWEVDAFKTSTAFQVRKYTLPLTHVLVFNPLSERVNNAQVRRSLSFAVNREGLLKSTVLRSEDMKYGRPTSAAWHLSSYATEPRQEPPRFNLRLAYALRFAAERQLQIAELMKLLDAAKAEAKKNKITLDEEKFRKETKVDYIKLPRLRFVVQPDPVARAATERMMIYWQRIGFEIDLVQGDQAGNPLPDTDWDFCYRTVRMEEPLLELWPLLANDSKLNIERLLVFPDWMRQEIVGLDYATSFPDAQEKLYTIHNHIAAQAFVIPLWEVDDYGVFRKNVSGVPDELMSTYQNIERWMIRP